VLGTFRTIHPLIHLTETGCLAMVLFFVNKMTAQSAYLDRYLSRNPTPASAVDTERIGWRTSHPSLFVLGFALADPWLEEC